MSYTITRKLDGQHLARFQIQDGFVEHTCAHLESAFEWLVENAHAWNGVQIRPEHVAVYEEVAQPVRLVKPATSSLEQRIARLEALLMPGSPI